MLLTCAANCYDPALGLPSCGQQLLMPVPVHPADCINSTQAIVRDAPPHTISGKREGKTDLLPTTQIATAFSNTGDNDASGLIPVNPTFWYRALAMAARVGLLPELIACYIKIRSRDICNNMCKLSRSESCTIPLSKYAEPVLIEPRIHIVSTPPWLKQGL